MVRRWCSAFAGLAKWGLGGDGWATCRAQTAVGATKHRRQLLRLALPSSTSSHKRAPGMRESHSVFPCGSWVNSWRFMATEGQ